MKNKKRLTALIMAVVLTFGVLLVPGMSVGAASTTPELKIAYCTLEFDSNIRIIYAVDANVSDVKVLVWTTPQSSYTYGTHTAELSSYGNEEISGETYMAFRYDDLAAKQMTDVVYAAAYTEVDGTAYYSPVNKYSILQYAYNMTGKTGTASTDTELIALLNNMLAYGASAQKVFNYKEDELATDNFYQVALTAGTLDDGCTHGLYLAGDTVTITAPATDASGTTFGYWADSTGASIATTAAYTLTVGTKNEKYTPVYGEAPSTEPEYSEGLEFESNGDGTCILLGKGTFTGTDLVIPECSPDGDKVTEIDASAFADEAFTSVTIPSSVTYIGRKAFSGCTSLTDVYYNGTETEWANIEIGTYNDVLEEANMHFETPETPDVSYTEPTIAVSSAIAGAGEQVKVTVSIYNNPGLCGAKLKLTHDADLTLAQAELGTALSTLDYTAPETEAQPYFFNWDGLNSDATDDGVLLTLTFNVADTAVSGEELAVEISYTEGDIYNANLENVTLDCVNGIVTVK